MTTPEEERDGTERGGTSTTTSAWAGGKARQGTARTTITCSEGRGKSVRQKIDKRLSAGARRSVLSMEGLVDDAQTMLERNRIAANSSGPRPRRGTFTTAACAKSDVSMRIERDNVKNLKKM